MASSMVWDNSVWWIGTAGTMCFLDMTFDAFYGHRWWNVRRRDLVVLEGFDVHRRCIWLDTLLEECGGVPSRPSRVLVG